jgi:hypothetical protein
VNQWIISVSQVRHDLLGQLNNVSTVSSCPFSFLLYSTESRSAVGPTKPPIQCVPGALSLGRKAVGS